MMGQRACRLALSPEHKTTQSAEESLPIGQQSEGQVFVREI